MKNNPIKLLFSAILLISQTVLCQAGSFDGNETKSRRDSLCHIALDYCFGTSSVSEYDIYISKEPVPSPKHGETGNLSDCRLVFVDMVPEANWEHPCKYIYVGKETGSKSYTCCSVDSCLPPQSTLLEPVSLTASTNRRVAKSNDVSEYGIGSIGPMGPVVRDSALMRRDSLILTPSTDRELDYYQTNKFASHTYAVILSGGSTPALNASRYWNDCSFIYKTLRKKYGVPKKNITVLMSDGKSPAADQNKGLSFSPDLENSSLDLDGDGRPDIDYSATKDTLKMVLSELKSKLTDSDHLLVFVTDHGGKDNTNGQPYINLWNSGRIYPTEFAGCFSGFNAGYISFVLGQCYSGGFIPALKANNHIVMTACSEDEESFRCNSVDKDYNEFLYNWTSYVNGSDTFGNAVPSDKDSGTTGKISEKTLKKAYEYAVEKDCYNKGKTLSRIETPQLSMLSGSTAEDLAFDTIPPTVYLYITRGNTSAPKDSSSNKKSMSGFFFNFLKHRFWTSSDIWLRNQNDGLTNREHQNPYVTEENPTVYVYTMVKNRGVKDYSDSSIRLVSFWAESAVVLSRKSWTGTLNGDITGGNVYRGTIRKHISPCDSIIVTQPLTFMGDNLYEAEKKDFKICLLSTLVDVDDTQELPADGNGIVPVLDSDRFAQRNQYSIIDLLNIASIKTFPTVKEKKTLSLVVYSDKDVENALDLRLSLPKAQTDGLILRGCGWNRFNPQEISLADSCSVIQGLSVSPDEDLEINLNAGIVADHDIVRPLIRTVDVAAVDETSGEIMGGEQFVYVINPRPKIDPSIDKTEYADGRTTLTAGNLNEDVSCEWYDKNGNLVGKGTSITLDPSSSSGEYTLRVVASKDNATNTASVQVERQSMIKTIGVKSPDTIDIDFNYPLTENVTARISSSTGNKNVVEYNIASGTTHTSLDIVDGMPEIMQLSLSKNGKTIETRKIFTK